MFKPICGTTDDMKAIFSLKSIDSAIAAVTEGVEVRPLSFAVERRTSATMCNLYRLEDNDWVAEWEQDVAETRRLSEN